MRKQFALAVFISLISLGNLFGDDTGVTDPVQNPNVAFRLFRTANFYTFLKLDTRSGRIWQVQFDVQGNNRFTVVLNILPLSNVSKSAEGRFTLYPTANMYNFILVDQTDGRTWQVQWSQDADNRGIIPILGAE